MKRIPWILGLLLFAALEESKADASSGRSKYLTGCPDTTLIDQHYARGNLDEIIKEIDAFRRYVHVWPKPCAVFAHLYYGIAKLALRDSTAGRTSWQVMLAMDPGKEVWGFDFPLFLQTYFDRVKLDMWQRGALQNAYAQNYIPGTFPASQDDAQVKKLREFYHNIRLNICLNRFEKSKSALKDYFLSCERISTTPDPALLVLRGELMRRYYRGNNTMLAQAAVSVEGGLDALKQTPSRLMDAQTLQGWGERILKGYPGSVRDVATRRQP